MSDANITGELNAAARQLRGPKAGGETSASRILRRAGVTSRGALAALAPADRAGLFMAIEAERTTMNISRADLCSEARLSREHVARLVARRGAGVSPRVITAAARALRALHVVASRPGAPAPAVFEAAYRGCFLVAADVAGIAPHAADKCLARKGAQTGDAAWLKASQARSIAIYLAHVELGVRAAELAHITGLTPAAVSISLGRVEDKREEPKFDAAMDRAAAKVRGR